jgi:hypothetical protein
VKDAEKYMAEDIETADWLDIDDWLILCKKVD